jgi:hypothetical protein
MSNILWLLTAFSRSNHSLSTKKPSLIGTYASSTRHISFKVSQLRAAQSERGGEADEANAAKAGNHNWYFCLIRL